MATYLPGVLVTGVRASDEVIAVHVTGVWPATLAEIASQVRAAVEPFGGAIPVSVTVEDLELPAPSARRVTTPGDNRKGETS